MRDCSILEHLDKNINTLFQREIFHHENYLDVTELIREREMMDKLEGLDSSSPLMRAHKRITAN